MKKYQYIQPEMELLRMMPAAFICGSGKTKESIPNGDDEEENPPSTADAKSASVFEFENWGD